MGACVSLSSQELTEVQQVQRYRHLTAEKIMREAKVEIAKQTKVLLLGPGDSGKTTVLKQMRLIQGIPFSPSEIESYREICFYNLTSGMRLLLEAMDDISLHVSESNMTHRKLLMDPTPDLHDGQPFPLEYYKSLKVLWEDPNVQSTWRRAGESALPENLAYFITSLDRLFDRKYIPSKQDIIHCRVRTTGILETKFPMGDKEMLIVDVGGQRSERRKWIHCFQDVTSVLFMVSLNGFDQCIAEDRTVNRMEDAMALWHSVCQTRWFTQTPLILFMNKNDLFERKIVDGHADVRHFFPDFGGDQSDVIQVRDYFQRRFTDLAMDKKSSGQLYIHQTTATDTALLKHVLRSVQGKQSFAPSLSQTLSNLPILDTLLLSNLANAALF